MHGWPHEETILATGAIRLATWGFEVVHMRDCSLLGEGIDFDGRRNWLAPMSERFGVLSLRDVALRPPKGGRLRAPSPFPLQNPG